MPLSHGHGEHIPVPQSSPRFKSIVCRTASIPTPHVGSRLPMLPSRRCATACWESRLAFLVNASCPSSSPSPFSSSYSRATLLFPLAADSGEALSIAWRGGGQLWHEQIRFPWGSDGLYSAGSPKKRVASPTRVFLFSPSCPRSSARFRWAYPSLYHATLVRAAEPADDRSPGIYLQIRAGRGELWIDWYSWVWIGMDMRGIDWYRPTKTSDTKKRSF